LKVFSNGQTMKYETLEDVYSFFGLAILKRNPSEELILERKKIPWWEGTRQNPVFLGEETRRIIPFLCCSRLRETATAPFLEKIWWYLPFEQHMFAVCSMEQQPTKKKFHKEEEEDNDDGCELIKFPDSQILQKCLCVREMCMSSVEMKWEFVVILWVLWSCISCSRFVASKCEDGGSKVVDGSDKVCHSGSADLRLGFFDMQLPFFDSQEIAVAFVFLVLTSCNVCVISTVLLNIAGAMASAPAAAIPDNILVVVFLLLFVLRPV
jgi:hypothetical protein